MKGEVKNYISTSIHEEEVEKLFNNFYHFGAHRSELSEKNSFVKP